MTVFQSARNTLVMVALCATVASPASSSDEVDRLPDGEGREDTYYACIACHSMQVVTRQGMTRGMWEDTINLMVERHGMFELEGDERELILTYLSEHFPAVSDTGNRRGWTNPFGQ